MSTQTKISVNDIQSRKKPAEPIVCLTAYTAQIAKILDPHCDLMLVGDSMAMVLYGMDSTIGITLDTMINHGKAVAKTANHACVVVDMPFGTYEGDEEDALANAQRIMDETGCDAIKLEGGVDMAQTISYLTAHDIPVMGHIGLQPQSVEKEGGYRIKGKTQDNIDLLIADAKTIEEAGVFALVLEATVNTAVQGIVDSVNVPVIGIGASVDCDGQILVTEDMLGLMTSDYAPKFVKKYATLADTIENAVCSYAKEVKIRIFPSDEHTYTVKKATDQ